MSSRLCSASSNQHFSDRRWLFVGVKCVMSKTTRPDGSLQHIYNATMKTNTVSSLFPNTPQLARHNKELQAMLKPGGTYGEGEWSFRVLCQTHSPNRGQWCPSMVGHYGSTIHRLDYKSITIIIVYLSENPDCNAADMKQSFQRDQI